MPLYQCMHCGCVENTALAKYWQRKMEGLALFCSACDPEIQHWHGQFPQHSAFGMLRDGQGHLWRPRELMSLPKTCTIVGIVQHQGHHPLEQPQER